MKAVVRAAPLVLVLFALFARGAEGQARRSVGLGLAKPLGDFGDRVDSGFTLRGQLGLEVPVLDLHVQAGYSRFPAAGGVTADDGNADIVHAGAGARVGLGLFWVGANVAYFFGDGDDGVGVFPELGLRLWRVEGIVDFRVDGDQKWGAVRVALRL